MSISTLVCAMPAPARKGCQVPGTVGMNGCNLPCGY